MLQSLGARRTSLDQRQAEMSTDVELLAASEKRVNERLAELQRVQGVVEGLLGKLNDEQEARVAGHGHRLFEDEAERRGQGV